MRRTLVLVVALGIVAMVAAPAQAGDRSGTGGPPVRAGAVSYLSPLHLGGMGIVESAGTEASGTDWRVGCWQAWAADYNWRVEQNRKAEEDAQQAAEDAADDAADDEQAPPTTAPPEPDLPYPDYGTNPLPGAGSAQLDEDARVLRGRRLGHPVARPGDRPVPLWDRFRRCRGVQRGSHRRWPRQRLWASSCGRPRWTFPRSGRSSICSRM